MLFLVTSTTSLLSVFHTVYEKWFSQALSEMGKDGVPTLWWFEIVENISKKGQSAEAYFSSTQR